MDAPVEDGGPDDPRTVAFSDDELAFEQLLDPDAAAVTLEATPDTRQSESNTEESVGDGDPETGAVEESDEPSLVTALADELEAGTVEPAEVDRLREHLGGELRPSVEARLDHVQTRIETFGAYIEALEVFLDENGTATQIQDELQTELEAVQDELQTATRERAALRRRIDDLEATVVTDDNVEAIAEGTVDSAVARYSRRLDRLSSTLDDLEDTVEEQNRAYHRLQDAFRSVPVARSARK
ncbi:hypothetical protein [Natronosalvus rutilus]|uniref:Uncharacterized protein n=1 Tax=Natronosalvus rutilus TaxID=2953753 RepID=A0A9E7NCB6_9EURY|nr:hypothetical protein [Natronosalvus rutilus]UTF54841.1 hypothetical protein NGM29_06140 [Natronosalvus rutilus]